MKSRETEVLAVSGWVGAKVPRLNNGKVKQKAPPPDQNCFIDIRLIIRYQSIRVSPV